MKLLFVLPEYPPDFGGGISTFYGDLLPALVELGHEVDVVVGSAFVQDLSPYKSAGVAVRGLEGTRAARWGERLSRFALLPSLRRALAAAWAVYEQTDGGADYDLVETVDWGLGFVPWTLAPDGPPTVVHLHGSTGQISANDPVDGEEVAGDIARLAEGVALRYAAALHTHSTANAEAWRRETGRSVDVLPPPIRPRPAQTEARTGPAFVAGRVQRWKGPHVLCDALRRLGSDAPVVEWAGRSTAWDRRGHDADRHLRETYPEIWGPVVRPLGVLRPEAVAERQGRAAFVVVPSLWDVYNLTAAEAMASGAVVVCSTGAGAVDLVEDGVNGFVAPAGDGAALADRVRQAADLPEREREAMGRAASEAAARLDPARVAGIKVEAYERALSAPRTPDIPLGVRRSLGDDDHPADLDAVLDHLPLRVVARHLARRTGAKLSARFGSRG